MKRLTIICLLAGICACRSNNKQNVAGVISNNPDSLAAKYHLNELHLPQGFKISVFAEVSNARSMCFGAKGTLFVGNRSEDKVYAVVDENKDGVADKIYVVAKGLNSPNGVAFKDGNLYVAEISRIVKFDDIENKLANPPAYTVVTDSYPDREQHGWKFIAFGPDGKLYVPVGAPCNVCLEKDSIFGTITRINTDGSGREIFAKGIRNSVGFDWQPGTNELWFTDNGRDNLGDDIPYCELNHAPKTGMHFGFPYVHQGNILDPEFGKGKDTADYTPPALKVGPHAAPLGMRFYTGNMFPAGYKNNIFIAEHGSWNRTIPYGYEVKLATVDGDKVTKYENFVTGWLKNDGHVTGRPVDVIVAADGALLISDDMNGVIYRVIYHG